MKKKILFYFSVAISLQCQAQDTEQIHQLIKLYKRPITFLGIMDAHEISPIAKEFPESVFVVIDSAPI
ncbi:MAG: hypothetical protein WD512_04930, partial [Candidatus Paceibacterota bacterium]